MSERDLFIAALKITDQGERSAWLDRECGGDAILRKRMDVLLQAFDQAGSLLENPVVGPGAISVEPAQGEAASGDGIELAAGTPSGVIGPYKLVQQIGEGGMGTVFMAEQQHPVRRKVALKLIKAGMDCRQVIARFEAERQALAMMAHPNIAGVLEAGATESGRPYFVMELVRGFPITDYCDQNQLTTRERLELFVAVCQAVQHAHLKGIIHRDIKPNNVLITLHDGRPVAKVIDFGIAKAIDQKLTDKTLLTGFAQMIGTPMYMSPEQVEMSGLDIDTRSDIYSLGVLLYELLTGTTPFDKERLRQAAFDEVRRIIREEEPPKPSTRISTLDQATTAISARSKGDPKSLSQLCRGDLDWIVMKALEKDRDRRYETASAFAADVLRHLKDEPVEACPPSALYKFRKLARRNRVTLTTAALVVAALVLGSSISTWQAFRATHAEGLARERMEAETGARNQAEAAEKLAEAQRRQAEANFQTAEEQRRLAREAVDEMYTQVAEKWLAHQPRLQLVQREFLEKALKYYREAARQEGADSAVRQQTARAHYRMGKIQTTLGRPAESIQSYPNAITLFERVVADSPGEGAYRYELSACYLDLGNAFWAAGQVAEAEQAFRQAVSLRKKLAAEFPDLPDYHYHLASARGNLALALGERHMVQEAEQEYREAQAVLQKLTAKFPARADYRRALANDHNNRGNLRFITGGPQAAEPDYRAALGLLEGLTNDFPAVPDYREVGAYTLANLGDVLRQTGRLPEAEKAFAQALAGQQKLADDFPDVPDYQWELATTHGYLGILLRQCGRREEAEKSYGQAIAIHRRLAKRFPDVPSYRQHLADDEGNLGNVLSDLKRFPEAEASYRRALDARKELADKFPAIPDYQMDLARTYQDLGQLFQATHRVQEAKDAYQQALHLLEKLTVDFPDVARYQELRTEICGMLALFLATISDPRARDADGAVRLAKRAVELAPRSPIYLYVLGVAHYRARNWRGSQEALQKAVDLRSGGDSHEWFWLAMAHWQLGEKEQARKWYDGAVEWMDKNKAKDGELRRFRAEAAELLGINALPSPQQKSISPPKKVSSLTPKT